MARDHGKWQEAESMTVKMQWRMKNGKLNRYQILITIDRLEMLIQLQTNYIIRLSFISPFNVSQRNSKLNITQKGISVQSHEYPYQFRPIT